MDGERDRLGKGLMGIKTAAMSGVILTLTMAATPNVAWSVHDGTCHDSHMACVMNEPPQGWLSYHDVSFVLELKPDLAGVLRSGFNQLGNPAAMVTLPSLTVRQWTVYDTVILDGQEAIATGVPPSLASGSGFTGNFLARGSGSYSIVVEVSLTANFKGYVPGSITCTRPVGVPFGPSAVCTAVPLGGFNPDGTENQGPVSLTDPDWVTGRFGVAYLTIRPWCVALTFDAAPLDTALLREDELFVYPKNVDPGDTGNVKSKVKLRLSGASVPTTSGTAYLGMWVLGSGGGHEGGQHISPRPAGAFGNDDTFVFFKPLTGNVDETTIYTASEFGGEETIGVMVSDKPFQAQASITPLNTTAERAAARTVLIDEYNQFRLEAPFSKSCIIERDGVPVGVRVKVPDLEALAGRASPDILLVGGTCRHHGPGGTGGCGSPDNNHFGTESLIDDVVHIAASFRVAWGVRLWANDMSLGDNGAGFGGRFDLGGHWSNSAHHTPQLGHSNGRAADLDQNRLQRIINILIAAPFNFDEADTDPSSGLVTSFQERTYIDETNHIHIMR